MSSEREENQHDSQGFPARKTVLISLAILCGGIVLLAVIFLTEPSAMREGATKETAMLVDVVSPEYGNFTPSLLALGVVRAEEDVILRPRVDGTIVERSDSFVPGAIVQKGDVLVQIDPADYENAVEQRKSALQQARAALQLEEGRRKTAQLEYELVEEELSNAQKSLVLRDPQYEDAVAAVESAKAALKLAELQLERTTLTAPFDAQVVSREVNVGSHVSVGDSVARLVGVENYWIETTIPLSQLGRLNFPENLGERGAAVQVRNRTAWPEGIYRDGYLYSFIGELEEQTRLARVIVEIPDPLLRKVDSDSERPKLILGSYVEAQIETGGLKDVVRLSRDYVRKNDTVWVKENQRLYIRSVEVTFRDKEFAYIASGLSKDDRVVTTNLSTVVDGARLRVEEEEESEPNIAEDAEA